MARKLQYGKDEMILSTMEMLVPENHLVRKLDKYIKFDFIRELTKPYYSEKGRPGYDPVVLFKIAIIKNLFGIPSIRQTCEELKVNIAYRYFLGIPFSEEIPDHSTYSKNYTNRFMNTNVYEEVFTNILAQVIDAGLLDVTNINIDSTHIKASANKRKYIDKMVEKEKSIFEDEMLSYINEHRKDDDSKPLPPKKGNNELKRKKESKTDPDSGWLHKGEKEHQFAYNAHTVCDKNGYILNTQVLPSNVHDTQGFGNPYREVTNTYKGKIKTVALDAGYISGPLIKEICDNGQLPLLPYKRASRKRNEVYKKLNYDENLNIYIHEEKGIYEYVNTTRQGYKVYRNKNKEEIRISVYEDYHNYVRDLRLSDYGKEIYGKRKETIERVFADAKERHAMRYTHYRGKKKVSDHVSLIFTCMNMKKMANFLEKIALITLDIFNLITKNDKKLIKTIKKDENFKLMISSF
ncbi:MAG: IS1182 family transposase [Candidatus Izemoplasmatales bacterium]|nr:IS1182 family transposase [Candidatus Izemoplasmatales bacterium]